MKVSNSPQCRILFSAFIRLFFPTCANFVVANFGSAFPWTFSMTAAEERRSICGNVEVRPSTTVASQCLWRSVVGVIILSNLLVFFCRSSLINVYYSSRQHSKIKNKTNRTNCGLVFVWLSFIEIATTVRIVFKQLWTSANFDGFRCSSESSIHHTLYIFNPSVTCSSTCSQVLLFRRVFLLWTIDG